MSINDLSGYYEYCETSTLYFAYMHSELQQVSILPIYEHVKELEDAFSLPIMKNKELIIN